MLRRWIPAMTWLALLASVGGPVSAQPPVERVEIVDRAIEFHGGDLYRETTSRMEICSKSGCYEIEARVDGDLFAYDVAGEVSSGRRRVLATNDRVRVWDATGEDRVAEGDEAQRMRDWAMERVYFAFLPYRLNDPAVYKTDLGLERWGDRELHRVEVSFAPGSSSDASDEFVYWFDPASGRLEQFAYSYLSSGGGIRFRRAFNHRRVGGILFFDQQNLGIDGPGLDVDRIEPQYVEAMRQVSTVELDRIVVESHD